MLYSTFLELNDYRTSEKNQEMGVSCARWTQKLKRKIYNCKSRNISTAICERAGKYLLNIYHVLSLSYK